MEYLKKALSVCCQDCCAKRKGSSGSTQIILPTTQKVQSKQGTLVNRSTFTYLAQPDFYIPFSDEKMITTVSPTTKRKQSAPPVMTRTVAIQPISTYTQHGHMHSSLGDPQIHVEHVSSNVNNNSTPCLDGACKCSDSESSLYSCSLSPTHSGRLASKRLSVAQIAANHSRRSSLCDIVREDLDSEMYESGSELCQDLNSNGKICFSITYDEELEILTVYVNRAKSLWNPEYNSSVKDSYVKVRLLSGLKKKSVKTAVQKGTSNPEYNDKIDFDGIVTDSLHQLSIQLSLYSMDKYSKKKKLGTVTYSLNNEIPKTSGDTTRHPIWRHLHREGAVVVGL